MLRLFFFIPVFFKGFLTGSQTKYDPYLAGTATDVNSGSVSSHHKFSDLTI